MYNIFQGNESVRLQICKSLDLDSKDRFGFTDPIYFRAFFYLQKRFGEYFIIDDHKDVAIWDFKVKYYNIRILLSSSRVAFMVFGPKTYVPKSPLWVKLNRMSQRGLYTNSFWLFSDETKWKPAFKKHLDSKNLKYSEATQEHLNNFQILVQKGSQTILAEQKNQYKDVEYSNAYTRHALRTLDQFLKNMLTPIYVRDVGFNIKGHCGCEFENYIGNVEITKIDNKPTPSKKSKIQELKKELSELEKFNKAIDDF